jgi:hypothetical protein
MSIQVAKVRASLVAVLDRIHPAIQTYEQVPHYPTVPCLIVYPPDTINYMHARDTDIAVLTVLLLVGPQDPTSQEVLEGFMSGTGALSVKAALYADRRLENTISNLRLLDMTSGAYSLNLGPDDSVIGAEFRIEITA